MAIAIRNGVRYRFRIVFTGPSVSISRYDLESNRSQWMFVAGHADDELEIDGDDAVDLAKALRALGAGETTVKAIEELLIAWFEKVR